MIRGEEGIERSNFRPLEWVGARLLFSSYVNNAETPVHQ